MIQRHPCYPVRSDKDINYFKNTKDTWIEAEVMQIKQEMREELRQRKELEKQGKRFLERLF
jgi:hypothetical protein